MKNLVKTIIDEVIVRIRRMAKPVAISSFRKRLLLTAIIITSVPIILHAASDVRINEVAPWQTANADWIEFYVAVDTGPMGNWTVWATTGTGSALFKIKTFPNIDPGLGDYILLQFDNGTGTDDAVKGDNNAAFWDIYIATANGSSATSLGLKGTSGQVYICNSTGAIVDAMAYCEQDSNWAGNNTAFADIVSSGQWTSSGTMSATVPKATKSRYCSVSASRPILL